MTFEQHAVLQKKLAEDARRKQEEKEKKDGISMDLACSWLVKPMSCMSAWRRRGGGGKEEESARRGGAEQGEGDQRPRAGQAGLGEGEDRSQGWMELGFVCRAVPRGAGEEEEGGGGGAEDQGGEARSQGVASLAEHVFERPDSRRFGVNTFQT